MIDAPPCGDPTCPVPEPDYDVVRHVRGHTLKAGTRLYRGHQITFRSDELPGRGDTRFAPLENRHHAYAASTPVAAALESLLHDAWGSSPRIHDALLKRWAISDVRLSTDIRVADLRDAELDRLGIARSELVASSPAHYPCTRRWATALAGRNIGGHDIVGIVWQSRQQELRAAAVEARPALASLIGTSRADVIVLWSPPASASVLSAAGDGFGALGADTGETFVNDLADLLNITIV